MNKLSKEQEEMTVAEYVEQQLTMATHPKWTVAYRDRGMGHGDYGVLREDRAVLAEGLYPEEAFLIGAAPRLLRALEALITQPSGRKALREARAAVKQAKEGPQ